MVFRLMADLVKYFWSNTCSVGISSGEARGGVSGCVVRRLIVAEGSRDCIMLKRVAMLVRMLDVVLQLVGKERLTLFSEDLMVLDALTCIGGRTTGFMQWGVKEVGLGNGIGGGALEKEIVMVVKGYGGGYKGVVLYW